MKNLIYLLFILLFFACNSPSESNTENTYEFQMAEKFRTFPMPADMGHLDLYFQILEDQYFFLFDYKTQKLLTYSIPENQLINTVQFEKEGPKGVGSILGVFVKSPTEIYLTSQGNVLFKFDDKGNLLLKTELNVDGLEEKGISLFSNIFTLAKDGFYFPAFPMVFDWTSLTPQELTEIPNLMR